MRGKSLFLIGILIGVLLLLGGCGLVHPPKDAPKTDLRWETAWVVLPDGREAWVTGQVVPWAPDHLLVEGDILVPRGSPRVLTPQGATLEPVSWGWLWPEGVVPYTVDPGVSEAQRQRIQEAIAHLHTHTPIRMVERTSEPDYVRFISDGKAEYCWSRLGRVGGAQDLDVYCGKDGVPPMGTVLHEILHALGFWHEQSRADRDEYVDILWENIVEEHRSQFQKIGLNGRLQGAYDYDSIMHYHAKAFSKNGGYTILPKNGVPPERLGQRQDLSPGDIAAIRTYYGTPLVRLRWWFHQTTFTTGYTFSQELRNVGAIPVQLERAEVQGGWLEAATPDTTEIPAGSSSQVSFRAKACQEPGIKTAKLRFLLGGGEAYETAYTRACYRYPGTTTLLRLDPAGPQTLQLTFAEWTWARRFRLEGTSGGSPIPLPVTELESPRSQPLYTALLTLPGWAEKEVCLRLTPLDVNNPSTAEACIRVPR
jgi:hypothetical protein